MLVFWLCIQGSLRGKEEDFAVQGGVSPTRETSHPKQSLPFANVYLFFIPFHGGHGRSSITELCLKGNRCIQLQSLPEALFIQPRACVLLMTADILSTQLQCFDPTVCSLSGAILCGHLSPCSCLPICGHFDVTCSSTLHLGFSHSKLENSKNLSVEWLNVRHCQ